MYAVFKACAFSVSRENQIKDLGMWKKDNAKYYMTFIKIFLQQIFIYYVPFDVVEIPLKVYQKV